ncbi:Glycosyltransferase involved in cell wall biogenesis [Hahella chejuensis KCTC 2396]|uniref:Glycosyltransferase involved in cell wall biogenesis n=1 Tax=Hahella chejuensis (strain KCTC 2396) TaxID=349521 RepID=Q2SJW3_HAHCH|nr:Glycosyltransferase involved in cell wall biogenesis [Hahella chejuensis KCTC 2396]
MESVLSQSYTNLELIVIDDGSSDASLDYLRSVDDPRYTLIEQENAGAHNAINKGLSLAKGDYLAILNSDDIFHRERLSECVERLQQGADLVATWIEIIDNKSKVLGVKEGWRNMLPWTIKKPDARLIGADDFKLNLLFSNFVSTTSNVVFSRKVYEAVGGMRNLRFAHDWDFLLRVALKFRCELLEKPLLKYRIHSTNTISSNRAWMLFEICWIFAVHLKNFSGELLLQSTELERFSHGLDLMANSINLQGNDKVFWMLMQYIAAHQKIENFSPEEVLLNREELRAEFIRYINV